MFYVFFVNLFWRQLWKVPGGRNVASCGKGGADLADGRPKPFWSWAWEIKYFSQTSDYLRCLLLAEKEDTPKPDGRPKPFWSWSWGVKYFFQTSHNLKSLVHGSTTRWKRGYAEKPETKVLGLRPVCQIFTKFILLIRGEILLPLIELSGRKANNGASSFRKWEKLQS